MIRTRMFKLFFNCKLIKSRLMRSRFSSKNNKSEAVEEEQSLFYDKIPEDWNLQESNIIDIGLSEHSIRYKEMKTGMLKIVATPIGNLEDFSIRMYQTIQQADIIACEDTRITGLLIKLLQKKAINEKLDQITNDKMQKFKEDLHYNEKEIQIQDKLSKLEVDDEHLTKEEKIQRWKQRLDLERQQRIEELKKKAKRLLEDEDTLKEFYQLSDDENDEYFQQNTYGLEDQTITQLHKRVKEIREKKNRGLLISYYRFNEDARIQKLITCMKSGLSVALISDAGTPCISDPGYKLISQCHSQNIYVTSIPGPSSSNLALTMSGFPADKYLFLGFISKNLKERMDLFEETKESQMTTVFYESPHRIEKTLMSLEKSYGPEQKIFMGIELTKLFESYQLGSVSEILKDTKNKNIKGEITVVVAPYTSSYNFDLLVDSQKMQSGSLVQQIDAQHVVSVLDQNLEVSDKDLADLVKQIFNCHKNKVQQIVSKHRHSGNSRLRKKYGIDL